MMDDNTYISTELKMLDEQVGYLSGIGYSKAESLNLLYLSIEQQKVNLQARMIAKSSEEDRLNIEKIAVLVYQMMTEGKDSDNGNGNGSAQI